jgi:hypothetical protein
MEKKRLLKLKGIAWFDHNGCDDAWNGRYGSLWKHQKIPELRNVIIAFLTARSEDYSVAGFDAGADDYITKPIKPNYWLARWKHCCVALMKSCKTVILWT